MTWEGSYLTGQVEYLEVNSGVNKCFDTPERPYSNLTKRNVKSRYGHCCPNWKMNGAVLELREGKGDSGMTSLLQHKERSRKATKWSACNSDRVSVQLYACAKRLCHGVRCEITVAVGYGRRPTVEVRTGLASIKEVFHNSKSKKIYH